jgi:hypothetical protein
MFTAMVLICAINGPVDSANCMTIKNNFLFGTEAECTQVIVDYLNSDAFLFLYHGHVLHDFVCYPWRAEGEEA